MSLAQAEPGTGAGSVLATIRLSRGRTLTVRTITHADADGLEALFDGLSDEDRYLVPAAVTILGQPRAAAG